MISGLQFSQASFKPGNTMSSPQVRSLAGSPIRTQVSPFTLTDSPYNSLQVQSPARARTSSQLILTPQRTSQPAISPNRYTPIKGESRFEYHPIDRKEIDYEEVRYKVKIPHEKVVTDYYAIMLETEYIPRIYQEKFIEYKPIEKVLERVEYRQVEKVTYLNQPRQTPIIQPSVQAYVPPVVIQQPIQYQTFVPPAWAAPPPTVSVMNRSIALNPLQQENWKWSTLSKSVLAGINGDQAYSGQSMYLATVALDPQLNLFRPSTIAFRITNVSMACCFGIIDLSRSDKTFIEQPSKRGIFSIDHEGFTYQDGQRAGGPYLKLRQNDILVLQFQPQQRQLLANTVGQPQSCIIQLDYDEKADLRFFGAFKDASAAIVQN